MPITHAFVSTHADNPADTDDKLKPSNWNAGHVVGGGYDGQVLMRDSREASGFSWLPMDVVLGDLGKFSTSTVELAFEGDSLTAGWNLPVGADYPTVAVSALSGYTCKRYQHNLAVGGSTVATMDARSGVADALATRATNWLVIWCGTNDIAAGATGSATLNAIVLYLLARRAAGWKTAILTMLPRADAVFEAQRDYFNTNVRAGWSGVSDLLIDVAADSRLTSCVNYTYFQADSVHLTIAGAAAVAEIVATALAGEGL